jgi:hypothetical protein
MTAQEHRYGVLDLPSFPERDRVEEAQRGDRKQHRGGGQLPIVDEIELVATNVLRAQVFRRLLEVAGEP